MAGRYGLDHAIERMLAQVSEERMNEHGETLTTALREARSRERYVRGTVVAEYSQTSCPVMAIALEVREAPGRKPRQNPLNYPRCGAEAISMRIKT